MENKTDRPLPEKSAISRIIRKKLDESTSNHKLLENDIEELYHRETTYLGVLSATNPRNPLAIACLKELVDLISEIETQYGTNPPEVPKIDKI